MPSAYHIPRNKGKRSVSTPLWNPPRYPKKYKEIYVAEIKDYKIPLILRPYINPSVLREFGDKVYYMLAKGKNGKSVSQYTSNIEELKKFFKRFYSKNYSEVKIFGNSKELSLENLLESSDDQNIT